MTTAILALVLALLLTGCIYPTPPLHAPIMPMPKMPTREPMHPRDWRYAPYIEWSDM